MKDNPLHQKKISHLLRVDMAPMLYEALLEATIAPLAAVIIWHCLPRASPEKARWRGGDHAPIGLESRLHL